MKLLRYLLILLPLVLVACNSGSSRTDALESPAAVLEAMKARYDTDWYKTLTFVQKSVQHKRDGSVDTTLWYEALELPGKLRIDIDEPNSGDALIFRNDSIYVFNNGTLVNARITYHPLLLLGFDVYFLPTTELVAKLDSLGFDLDTMHEATWQGRPAYVIGAAEGDEETDQFWIDTENLYFVRLLQKVGANKSFQQEVQFNKYEKLGNAWISPEVLAFVDGSPSFEEYYYDMTADPELDSNLFSPTGWTSATHWYTVPDCCSGLNELSSDQ